MVPLMAAQMGSQAIGAIGSAMKPGNAESSAKQTSDVSGRGEVGFDSSGWNVNFGNGAVQGTGSSKPASLLLYAALAVGALIVWKKLKSK
ncbi:hypothetical protein OL229_05200 [Neisseriaceae bacterium JH1-16]|nr:hypothetical protein [Neisseriaceae bacterium JH1-16]